MLKRNPDAIALIVLSFFLLAVPAVVQWRVARHRPGVVISQNPVRSSLCTVGSRLHGTVASLKQCLHPSSRHSRPIVRPL